MQVAADRAVSWHVGYSREREEAGQHTWPIAAPDRRRRGDVHVWRRAGAPRRFHHAMSYEHSCAPEAARDAKSIVAGGQVISMSGDRGLGMLLGELLALVLYKLPVKIIGFNNPAWEWSSSEGWSTACPTVRTANVSFDYAAIAQAAAIYSMRVEQPGDVQAALDGGSGPSWPGTRRPRDRG